MHKTDAGEKRKALKGEALELARDAKAARKAAKTLSDAREIGLRSGRPGRQLEG
jgi:hypothetical protein